jgi:hypothetical protein
MQKRIHYLYFRGFSGPEDEQFIVQQAFEFGELLRGKETNVNFDTYFSVFCSPKSDGLDQEIWFSESA